MSPAPRVLKIGLYGVGAIGSAVARALASDPSVRIVAAIDIDPDKAGRTLSSLLKLRGSNGVRVSADAAKTLRAAKPDVVIHTTGSRARDVAPQLEQILDAGHSCVTSCEEMAYPEAAAANVARALDRVARRRGVALLGAGVNPGFVMDLLVVSLSGAARGVRHVAVERVLDPLARREEFQKKVGLGMTRAEAEARVAAGRMGHVGLRESALLIARGMGWAITGIDEECRVLCEGDTRGTRRRRRPDAPVRGLSQSLIAREGRTERIRMEMEMSAGVEGPHDAIAIRGEPDLNLWIQGGIPGDQATVSCLINGMKRIVTAPHPGVLTVLDLPPGGAAPSPAPARRAGRRAVARAR